VIGRRNALAALDQRQDLAAPVADRVDTLEHPSSNDPAAAYRHCRDYAQSVGPSTTHVQRPGCMSTSNPVRLPRLSLSSSLFGKEPQLFLFRVCHGFLDANDLADRC
jgi:hypothetical protein